MTSRSLGFGAELGTGAARPIDFPAESTTFKGDATSPQGRDPACLVRLKKRIGRKEAPAIALRDQGSVTRVAVPNGAATYRVRLADPDGRFGIDIPLLSDTIAGALREVRFHSIDPVGFELWRGRRLVLKAFRLAEPPLEEPGREGLDRDDQVLEIGWR